MSQHDLPIPATPGEARRRFKAAVEERLRDMDSDVAGDVLVDDYLFEHTTPEEGRNEGLDKRYRDFGGGRRRMLFTFTKHFVISMLDFTKGWHRDAMAVQCIGWERGATEKCARCKDQTRKQYFPKCKVIAGLRRGACSNCIINDKAMGCSLAEPGTSCRCHSPLLLTLDLVDT